MIVRASRGKNRLMIECR